MTAFYSIPTCCTGLTLAGLNAYGGAETLKENIRTALAQSNLGYNNIRSFAMVMATTTNRQVVAKEVLDEIGFARTEPFEKTRNRNQQRHPETGGITLHYIHATDLQDWIDNQTKIIEEKRQAKKAPPERTRRFGAAPQRVIPPSCTIRDMMDAGFVPRGALYYDHHRFNETSLVRFVGTYGVTHLQYRTAYMRTQTVGAFGEMIRRFQRENNAAN